MPEKKRLVSVTITGILVLIGSAFILAVGILDGVVMLTTREQLREPSMKIGAIFAIIFLVIPSAWGIATGIGLLRLKRWARISILVFSSLLVVMAAFGIPVLMMIPSHIAGADASLAVSIRVGVTVFYALLAGIGIWWLVLFSRPSVRLQFAGTTQLAEDARPLSISMIGWLLILGAACIPFGLFTKAPMVLFGSLLTGWPAKLLYLGFGLFGLYLGVGLLRLKDICRTLTIYYLIFGTINSAFFYLRPGYQRRMDALISANSAVFHTPPASFPFPVRPFLVAMTALVAVQIYFLVTRKRFFYSQHSTSTPSVA